MSEYFSVESTWMHDLFFQTWIFFFDWFQFNCCIFRYQTKIRDLEAKIEQENSTATQDIAHLKSRAEKAESQAGHYKVLTLYKQFE
jgi:hypothetical protein